jgi:hypothetical protein
MAFYVGQKVVYVGGHSSSTRSDAFWRGWVRDWGITVPQKRLVYTVRDMRLAADGTQRLRVAEIVNPIVKFIDAPDQEPWWLAVNFRPLVEKKTDISFAHEILRTVTKPVPVDAETMRAFDRAMAEAYPSRQPDYIERHRK